MHYIYIPGFGDRFDPWRRLALRRWARAGVRVSLVPMHWNDQAETFGQKYERVLAAMAASDDEVHLVGESAGAAMALYVFLQHNERIVRLTTVCGYMHTAEDIVSYQRRRHPAFYPLVHENDQLLARGLGSLGQRIITIYSCYDTVVAAKYSRTTGARQVALAIPGHIMSIGYVLARGVSRLSR